MTRELFIKAINALEEQIKYDISVSEKLAEVFPNAYKANLLPDNHILHNMLLELLQEAMNDKVTNPLVEISWIEYYMYELDFGKENHRLKVYDKNKKEIPMSNASELYDALINGI